MATEATSFDGKLEDISQQIEQNKLRKAYELMRNCSPQTDKEKAQLLFLKGTAKMKETAWGEALSAFLQSETLWQEGPAKSARYMLEQILSFYDKQVYGQ